MKRSELKQLIREVITEVYGSVNENAIKWTDGVSVNMDNIGNPVGYKSLGYANSGIEIPESDDWRRFFVSSNGSHEKYLSPKLKLWYEVDSSG